MTLDNDFIAKTVSLANDSFMAGFREGAKGGYEKGYREGYAKAAEDAKEIAERVLMGTPGVRHELA